MVRYVRYEWLQDVRLRYSPGEQHEHQFEFEPTRLCHSCIDLADPNPGFRQTRCHTSTKRAALHRHVLPLATSAAFCSTCCWHCAVGDLFCLKASASKEP